MKPSSRTTEHSGAADVLRRLLVRLKSSGYRFITPTPETHGRILGRDQAPAADLRDVFGWNKPFAPEMLEDLFAPLREAGLMQSTGAGWRSRIRVATLGDDLLTHSSFPTIEPDAVFFGPDSYRFARLLRMVLSGGRYRRAVDLGGGAGVGVFTLARCAEVDELVMTETNPAALFLASVNAEAAGLRVRLISSGDLDEIVGDVDLITANPPFIAASGRSYSDGGELYGAAVALDWSRSAVQRLASGGKFIMYTGSPIVRGADLLHDALKGAFRRGVASLHYEEIDPDIFGEELSRDAYAGVERIAAVSVSIQKA